MDEERDTGIERLRYIRYNWDEFMGAQSRFIQDLLAIVDKRDERIRELQSEVDSLQDLVPY